MNNADLSSTLLSETDRSSTARISAENLSARWKAQLFDEIALALSGGCYRAAAFHNGMLSMIQWARQARSMVHCQDLRIVLMSGTLNDVDARKAGADAFPRKPHNIGSIVETIKSPSWQARTKKLRNSMPRLSAFTVSLP